ncbi:OLC1v1015995C1 [Oldenlandia corymbosa var. corymbosa]|uniref:OLC1v1015995C1 n=1 Tax=Oldenlandia corymbosa var. corymbosa TaxID=529605 RepID=A0AAV1E769_OLDCO|nr:OLC1v1015995C1 [Oldenlandia corymbosa var. corymbosa]
MSSKGRKRKQNNVVPRDDPISESKHESNSQAPRMTRTKLNPDGANAQYQIPNKGDAFRGMSGKGRKCKQNNVVLRDEPISESEPESNSQAPRMTRTGINPYGPNAQYEIPKRGATEKNSFGSQTNIRSQKEFIIDHMTGIDEQGQQQGLSQNDPMVNQSTHRHREESEIHYDHVTGTHEKEHEQGVESDSETETRGPTCMKSIWGRPPHLPKIHVEYNDKGDPVDGECSILSYSLGSIARNCQYCPIGINDWRKIENKDEILNIVKLRFHVPRIAEKKILSSVGKKWRNWKNRSKAKYWYEASVEVLVDQRDARVTAIEWMKICTQWNSEAAKKISRRRKNARAKRVNDQKTGQTSFARVEHKMTKENGRPPSRVELLRACFLDSNGDSNPTILSANANMQERNNHVQENFDDSSD